MATISQIKAARLLLNWKQGDLARISGMSLATIANLEQGKGKPRAGTLQVVQDTFEKFGVEFLEDHGVDLRPEKFNVKILHGDAGLFHVWEDYEKTLAGAEGGEVLLSNLDHQYMYKKYKQQLEEMVLRRPERNIRLRGLVREGDMVRIWPNEEFRAIPGKLFFGSTPVYVYGDKTAIVNFKDSLRIVLIDNKSIAEAFRQQFEHFWKNGKPVSRPVYMGQK
ncbi:MAG: helix-turn-helix domain-containing protein [Alphaproteobacteria bacterium]|nr:helix-turn-helix domain-containing protein [Alphaproteobacteria bacterium]